MPTDNSQTFDKSKARLRCDLRNRRRQLSVKTRARFDQSVNRHLLKLVNSHGAKSIACYWPFDGEPDIAPLCDQLMTKGCQLALPVISRGNDHCMTFHLWQSKTTLNRNRYGICEPAASPCLPVCNFDMLLMPLVGYDLQGHRIGMGAGYYDRHLESIRNSPTPMRVGVAYSLQEIHHVNEDAWDVSLHAIVNEHGCFTLL